MGPYLKTKVEFINQPEIQGLPKYPGVPWLPRTPRLPAPGEVIPPTELDTIILDIVKPLRDTPVVMIATIDSLLDYYEFTPAKP